MNQPKLKTPKYVPFHTGDNGDVYWQHAGSSTLFDSQELAQADADRANAAYAKILADQLAPDESTKGYLVGAALGMRMLSNLLAAMALKTGDPQISVLSEGMVIDVEKFCGELEAEAAKLTAPTEPEKP